MWNLLYLIFVSLIIIGGCHYGFSYLQEKMVDKQQDIISIQTQKYKDIIDEITNPTHNSIEDELLQFALDESNKLI